MIPNILTMLNLFSGCLGVVFSFTTDLRVVSIMIFICLAFDYADGMAARLLNVKSAIGKELDSLADLISFGLVPSLIAYNILHSGTLQNWAFLSFIMTVFSAYRLAKFNLDERQSVNFIGLPTPANAIFWSSFPLIILNSGNGSTAMLLKVIMSNHYLIASCVLVFSYLLIADLPLFSLKFSTLSWKDNKARHIMIVSTIILFFVFSYYALPFIIVLYIAISLLQHKIPFQ